MKKILVVGIILLFLCSSIPTLAQPKESIRLLSHTLYVGGSGPGNYTTIQDAIIAASDGDTVYVYDGTYNERLIINKSIQLRGESTKTIIESQLSTIHPNLILIEKDYTTISRFTLMSTDKEHRTALIRCCTSNYHEGVIVTNNLFIGDNNTGIMICANNSTIANNSFNLQDWAVGIYAFGQNYSIMNNTFHTQTGISLWESNNSIIINNRFSYISEGLVIYSGLRTMIINNTFTNFTSWAIGLLVSETTSIISNSIDGGDARKIIRKEPTGITIDWGARYTKILYNTIKNCMFGIEIREGYKSNITNNIITQNVYGISLWNSSLTNTSKNTFIYNIVHARFFNSALFNDKWDQNYWDRPRVLPKPILGIKLFFMPFPIFEFDWHPAKQPYDIPRDEKNI